MPRRKRGLPPLSNAKEYNDGHGLKKGNPGRPKGCKNLSSLLREKIIKAALNVEIEGFTLVKTKQGKILRMKNVQDTDLLKISSGLLPRESKVDLKTTGPMNIIVKHDYIPKRKT